MLKKNVFLRTTKLKAPPSQIQTQDKSNAKFINQKEGNHLHVEESLLSNHSSSTRTGSREKILSKHINTTFALSESQTSTTNKAKTSAGVKEDANCKETKIKSENSLDLHPRKHISSEDEQKTNEGTKNKSKNAFLYHIKNHEITFQKDSKISFDVKDCSEGNSGNNVNKPDSSEKKFKKKGSFLDSGRIDNSRHKKNNRSNDSQNNDINYINEAYKKFGNLNKTEMIKKIMEDNAKLQEEAMRSEEIISVLIDAWNIQKEKTQIENQQTANFQKESLLNPILNKQNISSFPFKKTINSMANLHTLPKSTDNTMSHRVIYKKVSGNNEKDETVVPIIIPNSKEIMRPRILKSTTPYKSEKKEIIKKFSEKDMNFEDINNFQVIYKFEEDKDVKEQKLPAINKNNNNQNFSFNNTFNPFNQTFRNKMPVDSKELTFSDKKMFSNFNTQNISKNQLGDTFGAGNKAANNNDIQKANILNEYYNNTEKMMKGTQKFGKLEPLVPIQNKTNNLDGCLKFYDKQNNGQRAKFPKDVFPSNIQKKFIV